MDDLHFYEYVMSLLVKASHITIPTPIYTNHTSNEAMYVDSAKDVVTTSVERELLSNAENISLLADMEWSNIIGSSSENVQIFSITVDFPVHGRSQNIADIHCLLQKYWDSTHSIVFFKNAMDCAVSFADKDRSHILSDWYEISEDNDILIEKIGIENMSVETCDGYFFDFVYAVAREYYIHPISFEEATYSMMPINYVSRVILTGVPFSRDEVKEMINANLKLFEKTYGYDFVEPMQIGSNKETAYHNVFDELNLISFNLELDESQDDENLDAFDLFDDGTENDDDLFDEDDEDLGDIDPAIYDDPILMVKWLEKKQKERERNTDFEDACHSAGEDENEDI